MFATFAGVKYRINIQPVSGLCSPPDGQSVPEIYLVNGLSNKKECLEVAIHEALHASRFAADEKTVDRTARDLARYLWRLGWRLEI